MPKPFFSKLVAMSAIGFFCVLLGCSFGIYYHDRLFIIISLLIGGSSIIRIIAFLQMIRKQAYFTLDGTCTSRKAILLGRNQQISFTTIDEKEYHFTFDKNTKLLQGHHYRLYFRIMSAYHSDSLTHPDLICYEELSSLKERSTEQNL